MKNKYQNLYEELVRKCTIAADLSGALALMGWDQETYMPKGAHERRAKQMATLASIHHDYITKEVHPIVKELADHADNFDEIPKQNIKVLGRDLEKIQKLPTEFVALLAEKSSETQFAWEQAYHSNKFADFAPYLEIMFDLKKKEADYYGYEKSPYDALLDSYEPGLNSATVTALFDRIKPELKKIIEKVSDSEPIPIDFLFQKIDQDTQWKFTIKILNAMGYNSEHGRQDISTHPFTTSFSMEDVRITTRIDESDLCNALYSSVHEGGHALYEQGLPAEYYGLPAGTACSLSIHESQSRVWENNVGRSEAFIAHYFSDLQRIFPDGLNGKTIHHVFQAFNVVSPSFIRTSADEVTYHFHILLRYEIEKNLMENQLKVSEIGEFWNTKMKEYLNIEVKEDRQGALQDVHWSMGAIGYFPTYSLGSFYAAQFYANAAKSIPDLEQQFENGNFLDFKRWMNTNVHRFGKLYDSETLCYKITGEKLNVDYFLQYIMQKLKNVYSWND